MHVARGNLGDRLHFILVKFLGYLSDLLSSVIERSLWRIYDQCFWLLSFISICLCGSYYMTCQYYEEGCRWLVFLIKKGRLLFSNLVEEEYSCTLPPILELPEEVMEMVVQLLSLRDRIRVSNVCKSWRKLLNHMTCHPQEVPWLMFLKPQLGDLGGRYLRFYSMCDGEFIKLRLPNHIARAKWDCLFSSKGWLLIAIEPCQRNHQLLLLDPLSGKTLSLPSLATLPFFDECVEWMISRPGYKTYCTAYVNTVRWIIVEIAVSASPADCTNSNDLLIAVSFNVLDEMEEKLAFCKPNDKEWTIFHHDTDIHPPYSGLLFYKGCCYANRYIYRTNVQGGRNNTMTECTVSLSTNVNLKVVFNDIIVSDHPLNAREQRTSLFVDSAEGDLLRVVQYKHPYEDGLNEGVIVRRTSTFDVFYFGNEENLKSLGDQVLFLSERSGAASLSSIFSSSWIGRNSIYFQASWTSKYHELGVFDVEDEVIEPFIPDQLQLKTVALWFTPKSRSTRGF